VLPLAGGHGFQKFRAVLVQIPNGFQQTANAVPKLSNSQIATSAQQTSNLSGLCIVIDCEFAPAAARSTEFGIGKTLKNRAASLAWNCHA